MNRLLLILTFLIISINVFGHSPYSQIPVIGVNKAFNSERFGLNFNHTYFYLLNFGAELQFNKQDLAFYGGIGYFTFFQTQYSYSISGQKNLRFKLSYCPLLYHEAGLGKGNKDNKLYKTFRNVEFSLFVDKGLWENKKDNYYGLSIGYVLGY